MGARRGGETDQQNIIMYKAYSIQGTLETVIECIEKVEL